MVTRESRDRIEADWRKISQFVSCDRRVRGPTFSKSKPEKIGHPEWPWRVKADSPARFLSVAKGNRLGEKILWFL